MALLPRTMPAAMTALIQLGQSLPRGLCQARRQKRAMDLFLTQGRHNGYRITTRPGNFCHMGRFGEKKGISASRWPEVRRGRFSARLSLRIGPAPALPRRGVFIRSVAQPGSAPALGAGGRWFESSRSDHFYGRGFPRFFAGQCRQTRRKPCCGQEAS